jgi:Mg-chelatase subunit ChlD
MVSTTIRGGLGALTMMGLLLAIQGCVDVGREVEPLDTAPYQAEVEEGLGAAVALLLDTSGSMDQAASGDSRPKYQAARSAIQEMLNATDEFVARRPDFPIKIALYHFSSDAWQVMPIQSYDRAKIQEALEKIPAPGGGTALGSAMHAARPELYRSGTFRKYLLLITDGMNTTGPNPEAVARNIHAKSDGSVQIYFVAFDTYPDKFDFLKEVGGDVLWAKNEPELRAALEEIYHGKILAEEIDAGEQ